MITLKSIRTVSSSPSYTRGNQLYKQRKVLDFEKTEDREMLYLSANVTGSAGNQYHVQLQYHKQTETFKNYVCQCEAWQSYSGMCKHCVAVALEEFYFDTAPEQSSMMPAIKAKETDQALTNIIYASSMREKARYLQPELTGCVELIPIFKKDDTEWSLEFKIGASQKYVLKNISQMIEAMDRNDWVKYGKNLAFYHERSVFTPKSQDILQLLEQYILHEQEVLQVYNRRFSYGYRSYYYHSGTTDALTKRSISLTDEWMVRFAEILTGESCTAEFDGTAATLTFKKGNPLLKTSINAQADGGYQLAVPAAKIFQGKQRVCIQADTDIYVCSRDFSRQLQLIGDLFTGRKKTYSIHPKDAPSFCTAVLPILKEYTSCQADTGLEQYEPKPCQVQVYLDWQEKQITAKAVCSYGETSYNVIDPLTASEMYRDFEKEHLLLKTLDRYFLLKDSRQKVFLILEEDSDSIYRLLTEGIGALSQLGQLFVSESLKRLRIVQAPRIKVGVSICAGLLEVDFQAEQLPLKELDEILESYRRKKKFFRLTDGSFLQLEDNALSAMAELAEGLDLKGRQLAEGHLKLPGYRSFYLDQILREDENHIQVNRSKSYKALLREMKNVEDSDFEEPEGLLAELRPYQKFGYRWMMTLQKLGFGGILADDMGLGKTVQAIAYLLARKQTAPQTAVPLSAEKKEYLGLIVCPASLVYNWESEIRRFAPSLSVATVTGTAADRHKKLTEGTEDILLTSYDLLKRDMEWYQDIHFQNTIIDEAQNIKNYTTQASKAVKALDSAQRFALTGTPIENSLSELWSIFDFLMPGILSTNKQFRTNYEQPIAASQDERAAARLKKMIRPYILRRVKSEVLKELPDKIEKTIYSQMEEEQKKLYDANLQKLLASLKKLNADEFRTGKLQILAELTKLRQLCCDPSLVYENYNGNSAKTEACMELIRSGAASGSQMLVFSQFTTALDLIARRLEEEKIP